MPAGTLAPPSAARIALLTCLALLAFASNSLLGRMALAPGLIDPSSFTTVRVASAAAMLSLIVLARRGRFPSLAYASWRSVLALLAYALLFSFAYLRVEAGTGALILFAAVQVTMFAVGLREGERFSRTAWGGFAIAVAGLVWLLSPGVSAPDPLGALLMIASGIAWGAFTLLARGVDHPVEANAANFICCIPPALAASLVFLGDFHAEPTGLAIAVASGALTSGLGYAIWYMALRGLTATRAATVQLSAPAITALAGASLLSEPLTLRLVLSSAAVLGGVAIVLSQKGRVRGEPVQ